MSVLTQRPPPSEPAKVDQTTFLRVIWAGVSVSLLFLLIRLFARWKIFKRLFFDDFFVIFAWILALLTAIDWQIVAGWMFQFIGVTSGQHWPPPSSLVKDTEKYYKGSVVVLVFFYTSLWAVKISFLLFFKRLGQNVIGQKVLWWCVLAFTLASYFVCIGDIQFSCLAAPLQDIFLHCSRDGAVHFQQVTLKFNCAIDVLTDFAIMAIPISMLWRVQMSLRKKAALVGIFSLAVITCVFAIVRVTVISTLTRQPDTSWSYMWSSVEQCVAIIVACLASFRTLFTQQPSQPKGPRRSIISDSKNMFLHGTRRLRRHNETSIGLTGLSSLGSTDEIVPTDDKHMTGQALETKEDVESWGGQSVFQQLPSNEDTPEELKHTRRGRQEGL